MTYSSVFAYALKSAAILTRPGDTDLHVKAFDFGHNLGLYLKAYHEEVVHRERVLLPSNSDDARAGMLTLLNRRPAVAISSSSSSSSSSLLETVRANALRILDTLPLQRDAKHCFCQLFNC